MPPFGSFLSLTFSPRLSFFLSAPFDWDFPHLFPLGALIPISWIVFLFPAIESLMVSPSMTFLTVPLLLSFFLEPPCHRLLRHRPYRCCTGTGSTLGRAREDNDYRKARRGSPDARSARDKAARGEISTEEFTERADEVCDAEGDQIANPIGLEICGQG